MGKELARQQDLIDVAHEMGGKAYKSNNRFLAGVCDLVVKIPKFSVWHLEAKENVLGVKGGDVYLDLTPLQRRFLMQMMMAGGVAGVASFVLSPHLKGKLPDKVGVRIFPYRDVLDMGYSVPQQHYTIIGRNWKDAIRREIANFGQYHGRDDVQ